MPGTAARSRMKVTYKPWTESRTLYDPEELAEVINESGVDAVVVEADFVLEETFEEAPGLEVRGDMPECHDADRRWMRQRRRGWWW